MRWRVYLIGLFAWILTFPPPSAARADEPSLQQQYLYIYLKINTAEHSQNEGDYRSALAAFKECYDGLARIHKTDPNWESALVIKRMADCKSQVEKLTPLVEAMAPPTPIPTPTPVPAPAPIPAAVENPAPAPMTANPPTAPDTSVTPAAAPDTTALQQQVALLKQEIETLRQKYSASQSEVQTLRGQLTSLNQQLAAAKSNQSTEDQVGKLLTENKALTDKLTDAQKQIDSFKSPDPKSELSLVRTQLKNAQEKLDESYAANTALMETTKTLRSQLDQAQADLAAAKQQLTATPANSPEYETLKRENEVMRAILTRELQEQSRRDESKRLAQEEYERLRLTSKVLQEQLDILGSPMTPATTDDERALLANLRGPGMSAPQVPPNGNTFTATAPDPNAAVATAAAPTIPTAPVADATVTAPTATTPVPTPAPVADATAVAPPVAPPPAVPSAPAAAPDMTSVAPAAATPDATAPPATAPTAPSSPAAAAPDMTPPVTVVSPATPTPTAPAATVPDNTAPATAPSAPVAVAAAPSAPPAAPTAPDATAVPTPPPATPDAGTTNVAMNTPTPTDNTPTVTHIPQGTTTYIDTTIQNNNPNATEDAQYANKPKLPDDMRDTAQQAADLFKMNRYDEAAAKYQTIIDKYPESLYAWSNLGVVRFQQQNMPEALKALQQAVKLAPTDGFSFSNLGIVYYQMGQYENAIDALEKAIALDPNDAKSYNYLGCACSQKGWEEEAEKKFRKAIDLDPNFGDAHFNLALVYATQKPPSLELARHHYKAALDLGIAKDARLEKLLNK